MGCGAARSSGMSDVTPSPGHGPEAERRDFLLLVAGALGAVGAASALWPFISSLEPAADTLAAGAPVDVDLSPVKPGQQITIAWRGRPVWILHRTDDELKMLQSPQDVGLLRDANSTAYQQPKYAQNWHRSIKPEWAVLVGICTHLGCIPNFEPLGGASSMGPGWPGGYFCPCHGSKYDLAGRVFAGVPAPYNLPVPPYNFIADNKLRIGENPQGSDFDLAEVEQI
jgi:ubiquinol-cytochrome c reductase iron-sulfur subunit